MIGWIILLLIVSISLLTTFSIIDSRKYREIKTHPFISFIISTYNDCDTISETIKSIYESYDNFEVFVVNDKSTDNTSMVIQELQKMYNIFLINNQENIGKAHSINNAFELTKGDIIFILDSDTLLNKKAVWRVIRRFDSDEKVGGVSCRYKSKNKGFLPSMQDVEYSMLAFTQSAYNIFSTISMWGGCMAFRRKAFVDIGKLSPNFLSEDLNASFKLKDKGWKCEQTNCFVYTKAPDNIKSWYKQKKRWSSGFIQNVICYPKIFFKNPLACFFMITYSLFTFLFIYGIFTKFYFLFQIINLEKSIFYLTITNSELIIKNVMIAFLYPISSIPYLFYDKTYRKSWRIFLIFPYSILYYPFYAVINLVGFGIGAIKYNKLKNSNRAW